MFKFHCPHCQQHISAEASQIGISAQCPTCGGGFVVPQAEDIGLTESGSEASHEAPSSEMSASQEAASTSQPQGPGAENTFGERQKDGSKVAKEGAKEIEMSAPNDGVKTISAPQTVSKNASARWLSAKKIAASSIGIALVCVIVVFWTSREGKTNGTGTPSAVNNTDPSAPISKIPELEAVLKPLRAAAEKGDHEAMFQIGKIYLKGHSGYFMPTQSESYEERMKEFNEGAELWFTRATDSCSTDKKAELFFRIGMQYPKYLSSNKPNPDAIKWMRKSADLNYAEAQNELSLLYFDDDEQESAKWTIRAAEQGVVEAQSHAGVSLLQGIHGFPKDYEKSEYWSRKAAEKGDAQAQCTMAMLTGMKLDKLTLEGGLGDKSGIDKSSLANEHLAWLQRAARQGEARAQFFLGEWYFHRSRGNNDFDAYKWFLIANLNEDSKNRTLADHHKERLHNRLESLSKNLSAEDKSKAQAQARDFSAVKEPLQK